MADNTEQFQWIVTIEQNLDWLFADDPNVFVAGDLLWYPVEGNNKLRLAPDAMVAFGRPKGKRGSYQQWKEENIPPQVVFEILSPGNTKTEMDRKLLFYDRYGVEEYYLYDPDRNTLKGWQRIDNSLEEIASVSNWISPRLKIRFNLTESELLLFHPDGRPFFTLTEVAQQLEQERQQLEQERQRAEQAEQRADRLAEQLRAMGIDPDQISAGE